jgi:hypothetical protein
LASGEEPSTVTIATPLATVALTLANCGTDPPPDGAVGLPPPPPQLCTSDPSAISDAA